MVVRTNIKFNGVLQTVRTNEDFQTPFKLVDNAGSDTSEYTLENIANVHISDTAAINAAKIADGSITNTEFQALNGVLSNIQTQLDGKAASVHTHAETDVTNLVADLAKAYIKQAVVVVYNDGGTYKAIDGITGAIISSGSVAETVIQAAIDAVPTTGGLVFLKAGTYTLTGSLTFATTGLTFQGEGHGTLLQCDGATVSPLLKMVDTTKRSEIRFKDFSLKSTTLGSGTAFDTSYFTRALFQNIRINDFNKGFVQSASTNYNIYENCHVNVRGAGGIGYDIGTDCNDNILIRCRCQSSDSSNVTGIKITGVSNTLVSCNVEGGTTDPLFGIDILAAAHSTCCVGCYLEACETNLRLASGVEGVSYVGGNISNAVTANITDNGAAKPFFFTRLNFESFTKFGYVDDATIKDSGLFIVDDADNTKKLALDCAGITTATTRTLIVPNANDTIAVLALAQSFITNAKTFFDNILALRNPANTFSYFVRTSAIAANRDISLPLLTANDIFAMAGFANAWGAVNQNIASGGKWQEGGVSISPIGLHDVYVPASAMWPRTTGACAALAKTEIATSLVNIQTLDFDQTTQEFAQFTIVLPRNFNNGTIKIKVYWSAAAGTGGVVWGLKAGAYSDDDALSTALGTEVTVTDTLLATNDVHISPQSAAITIAGTPADADFIAIQISRNPADASDTLTADAKLLGVSIEFTTDAAVAA